MAGGPGGRGEFALHVSAIITFCSREEINKHVLVPCYAMHIFAPKSLAISHQHAALIPHFGSNIHIRQFEMMDVSVTVLGLSGITSEAVKTKKSTGRGGMNGGSSHGGGPPRSRSGSRNTIGASSSSGEYSHSESDIPVTAVASFFKNVTSNKTSIGTHLPSLALGMPTSSFGNTSRYMASWPSPASASSRPTTIGGGGGIGNASFKFSRVMRRHAVDGSWDGEDDIAEGAGGGNGVFAHETMDILVGLARGSDMIPLGVATLVITGEEMGEVQVNLPVKTGSDALASMMNAVNLRKKKGSKKGNKSKMFQALAKGAKNSKKGAFFKVAPGARYRLDDTAALRLVVKAQPRNGGYDVEGSVVSGLSCPTGSSEDGSSSESSSSESEDDYDDEYEEEDEVAAPVPVPVQAPIMSRQNSGPSQRSGPSVPSRASRASRSSQGGRHGSGIPPMAGQTYNPRIPPMQNPAEKYHHVQNSMMEPNMHQQHYQQNMLPSSPRHHVKTHMMEQQMHQKQLMLQQQRREQGLGLQLPYEAPPHHRGGHPHFDIPPVASEASTEPGYGDEFEGIVGDQPKQTLERNNAPTSMQPIKMKGKSHSSRSRETAITTSVTSEDSSARFMTSPNENACQPLSAIFSCGAMSNLCVDDDDDDDDRRSLRKKKKKPPVKDIFAHDDGNKMGRKSRSRGEGRGQRRSRHDEYDENTILSSESETVVSMGSETFQDMEATREKLRAYAQRMGLDPEQLV